MPERPIRRGDVFWVAPDDARGPAPPYPHPYVVVQDDVINDSRVPTVVACATTTDLRKATEPGNVRLDPGEGGLPRPSVVVVSRIDAVARERFGERLGALAPERVDEILAGLRFQQASARR